MLIKIREYHSKVAKQAGNIQHQIWSLSGQSANFLRLGRDSEQDKPVVYLEEAAHLFTENKEGAVDISVHGSLAYAYLRRGDFPAARRVADQVLQTVTTVMPTIFSSLDGLFHIPEVYLVLWENEQDRAEAGKLACSARPGLL
ncbi:MAG: hypothetical protein JXB30_15180 [Anaerolineae bacterium]|nr:hypothetical protein [Anaerolineae bacterium]